MAGGGSSCAALSENAVDALSRELLALEREGRLEEALARVKPVYETEPYHWGLANGVAHYYELLRRAPEGEAYFEGVKRRAETRGAADFALAKLRGMRGRLREAADSLRALVARWESERPEEAMRARSQLAWYLIRLGENDEARRVMEKFIETADTPYRKIMALQNLADFFLQTGDHASALARMEEAEALYRASGDYCRGYIDCGQPTLYSLRGQLARRENRFDDALEAYQSQRAILAKMNADASQPLGNMAIVYADMGELERSLVAWEGVLRAYEKSGQWLYVSIVLGHIGDLHAALGNMKEYEAALARSLRLSRETGAKPRMVDALLMAARHAVEIGKTEEARRHAKEALALCETAELRAETTRAALLLGSLAEAEGDSKGALSWFERALAKSTVATDSEGKIRAFHLLGNALIAEGKNEEGLKRHEEGLSLAAELPMPEIKLFSHTRAAEGFRRVGKSDEAARHYREAIAVVEGIRESFVEEKHRTGYLGKRLDTYENLVELLVDSQWSMVDSLPTIDHQLSTSNSASEAFSVAERMKARSFLDELGAAKFSRAGVSEELLREKRMLEARMKWLQERAD